MKKIFTFSNLLAVGGLTTLLLCFMPGFEYKTADSVTKTINIFQAIFGTDVIINPNTGATIHTVVCGGLLAAFIFMIVGIVLNIVANKSRLFNFLSGGFYIASGVLMLCGLTMLNYSNYFVLGKASQFAIHPNYAMAVGIVAIIVGAFCLISGLSSLIKPKQQEVY